MSSSSISSPMPFVVLHSKLAVPDLGVNARSEVGLPDDHQPVYDTRRSSATSPGARLSDAPDSAALSVSRRVMTETSARVTDSWNERCVIKRRLRGGDEKARTGSGKAVGGGDRAANPP